MTLTSSLSSPHTLFSGKSHHYTYSQVNRHYKWFVTSATHSDSEPLYACVVTAFKQNNGSIRYTLFSNQEAVQKAKEINRNNYSYKISGQFSSTDQARRWIERFHQTGFRTTPANKPLIQSPNLESTPTLDINS
jgi:hypothetical protein